MLIYCDSWRTEERCVDWVRAFAILEEEPNGKSGAHSTEK